MCDENDEFELPILDDTSYNPTHTDSTCSTKGVDTYIYKKDGQEIKITVESNSLNVDNHVLDENEICTECGKFLGITYEFDDTNKTCNVKSIGYKAEDGSIHTLADIEIPQTVTKDLVDYTVTSMNTDVFKGCITIKSLVLPDSITSISEYAFKDCTSLESIILPITITSIERYTFANCSSLKEILFPFTIKSIGEGAFAECTSLESILMPSSITSIGERSFWYC